MKILLAAVAVTALVLLGRAAGAYVQTFVAWVDGLGAWGPVVFVAGYVAACVAFVPGALLTIAAGVIFGLGRGVLIVFAGALMGSTAAFLVSRHLARRVIEKRVASDPRFAAIDQAIARDGLKIAFLLRLSPVFPFNLLNYALGLTRVTLRDYLLASLGMIPGTVLYVYYGTAIGSLAQLAAGAPAPGGPGRIALLVVGLLATIAVTVVVTRVARRALAQATGDAPGSAPADAPGGAAGDVAGGAARGAAGDAR